MNANVSSSDGPSFPDVSFDVAHALGRLIIRARRQMTSLPACHFIIQDSAIAIAVKDPGLEIFVSSMP
jgi:hypothetical protein